MENESQPSFLVRLVRFFGPWRASLLSALLIAASHPPLDLGPLILVALVPWLLALPHFKTTRGAIWCGFAVGYIYYALGLFYLSQMASAPGSEFAMYGMWLVVPIQPALGLAAFGGVCRWAMKRFSRRLWLVIIPTLWIGMEFFRAYGDYPDPLLVPGYALHHVHAMIQMADLGGIQLVSFFVLLINGAFATAINSRIADDHRTKRLAYAVIVVACALSTGYGIVRFLQLNGEIRKDGPLVACIQPNIPQDVKLAEDGTGETMHRWTEHEKMSREVASHADLIVWSETSYPWTMRGGPQHYRYKRDPRWLARDLNTPMVIGSLTTVHEDEAYHYPYLSPADVKAASYNTAWYIGADGSVLGRYDKVRLVPGGEYIPFRGTLIGDLVMDYAKTLISPDDPEAASEQLPNVVPGYRKSLFTLTDKRGRDFRFSTNICYEFAFPRVFTDLHREQNVHFAINLSNEGWYFQSAELDQAMIMTRFRAIESRTTFVRATNTGIGAIIDPMGRVRHLLEDAEGNTKEVRGVLMENLPYFENPQPTIFLRTGMWLGWITGVAALALMAWSCGCWFAAWPARRKAKRAGGQQSGAAGG